MRAPTLLALLVLSVLPSWAQVEEAAHPEVEALRVVWEFEAEPGRVREALLGVLAAEEMALDPEAGEGAIVTVYVDFKAQHYGADNVAEPAPDLTDQYMFLQPRNVKQGRMRLHARVQPSSTGTQVNVQLDLLVRAFHALARGGSAEAVRRSNGSIEAHLQRLVEQALAEETEAAEQERR